jgi:hypothetical protein
MAHPGSPNRGFNRRTVKSIVRVLSLHTLEILHT